MIADWSKAPVWANKLATNPYNEQAWLGEEGYSYLVGNGCVVAWTYETAFAYTAFQIIETRPVLWNGEGVPPAGVVCEVCRTGGDIWRQAEILYVGKKRVFYRDWEGDELSRSFDEVVFRPLRTPEQIAAEERKLQREQLAYLIAGYMGFDDPRETDTKLAAYIFDHDYRKQVAP